MLLAVADRYLKLLQYQAMSTYRIAITLSLFAVRHRSNRNGPLVGMDVFGLELDNFPKGSISPI